MSELEALGLSPQIQETTIVDPESPAFPGMTVVTVFTQDFVNMESFHLTLGTRFGAFRTLPQNRLPANALVVTDLDESVFKRLFADRVFGVTSR